MTSIQRVAHDPDWYEPYRISLAIKANGLVFVSGQAGIDEHGRTVAALLRVAGLAQPDWLIEIDAIALAR
jgi:enamine deaminase RidA (YjgF/YER057c/UK114 family)